MAGLPLDSDERKEIEKARVDLVRLKKLNKLETKVKKRAKNP